MNWNALVVGLILSALAAAQASARVFDYKSERLAPYLRGTTGLSRLAQDPYANSSGLGTDFKDDIKYNFSGEIGLLIGLGDSLRVRLGAEAIRPKELETQGTDSGGSPLFTLTSSIFVFNPTLTIEYVYSGAGDTRFYLYGGAGYAQITMDNAYVMTTAGNTAFNPISNYTEKSQATVYEGHAGMGFETLFTDNVTFSMDFGYRYLPVRELKHKDSTATIAESTVATGGVVKNHDGSNRTLDLGGLTVGAGFRFYLAL